MTGRRFAFGGFVLNSETGTLLLEGVPVSVGYRAFLLLTAFLGRPGEVLTKSDLMDAAWQGAAVEETNLTVQIASLRKQLGMSPGGGEWIATVPRVGYRFVGAVKRLADREDESTGASKEPESGPSIAVLPFVNISADPDQEYFADGIVEDIITALSRFRSFAVIARNSSFVYKGRSVDVRQVARELGVRYVLEGSVRRAGNRLRITAQLVDGVSGAHLWADRFDGAIEDVFDVQDRITESVATIVEPQIRQAEIERSRRERPDSIAAYDLYLQALPKLRAVTQDENAAGFALVSKAIVLEPNNAVILSLALTFLQHRVVMGWPALSGGDGRAACLDLTRHALALANDDALALARCGNALVQVGREYDQGLAILRRAVELNPNDSEVVRHAGIGNIHCGSLDDALTYFNRAARLSPADPYAFAILTGIAHVRMILGEYAEALAVAERSLAASPNYDPTYWMLIAANAQLGRMDEARGWVAKFRALVPGITVERIKAGQADKDPTRLAAILDGLRLAGLEEG